MIFRGKDDFGKISNHNENLIFIQFKTSCHHIDVAFSRV